MSRIVSVVTGGAGFIGSHLVDVLLERGHEVRVIDNLSGGHASNLDQHKDNPKLACHWLDINTLAADSAVFTDATYCFHLAGIGDIVPSIEQPANYMQTNVQGTVRVLEAARAAQVKKFVYASSSSCYGLADTPTTEEHPIKPLYPYALSKYMGEMAVFHWGTLYELPVNAICIFNAYGTRVRTTGAYGAVFGVFLKQKLAGKPFTVVGDGTQSRDFVYVTDVAKAFLAAAETPSVGQRFNIGAGKPQSINRLVELLEGVGITYVPKRPGEPDVTFADISKSVKLLGWSPEITFEDGVKKMLADRDRWSNAPLWDVNSISKATEKWFQYMSKV
jgi:UDP-glucose 4-epimerase